MTAHPSGSPARHDNVQLSDGAHQEAAKPSWRGRLSAWWHGTQARGGETETHVEDSSDKSEDHQEPTIVGWPPQRIKAVQDVFGAGFVLPGGATMNQRLYMPVALDANKSVIELCAGMGAMTRDIAARLGVWMTAYEADPILVGRANALADQMDLEKRAPVKCLTLDRIEFKERKIDAVIAREGLYRWPDKQALFSRIRKGLRPSGIFSCIDYFGEPKPGDRIMDAWSKIEPEPPHLVGIEQTCNMLKELGFSINVREDITADYIAVVLADFAAYAARAKELKIPMDQREWAINEGEHWAIKLGAMQSGLLKVHRILARIPAEARQ